MKLDWATGITQIRWALPSEKIRTSPAAIYRKTGVMILNPAYKGKMSKEQWFFIMLHELGHMVLQTTNEKAVDRWAFIQYAKRGHSLREAAKALTSTYPIENEDQLERARLQVVRALNFQNTTPRPIRSIKL
jgi:hypothetical protein